MTKARIKRKGNTMNDTDLLEAAAKVVDIPVKSDFKERFDYYMQDRLMWNPLRDDGDALRLAMALYSRGFMLEAGSGGVTVTVSHPVVMADEWCPSSGTFDPCAATRRAIVRAAAEIGKGVVTPND